MKKSLGPGAVVYPTPVFLVGTYDASGHPNIMNVAWGGICCSQPPCIAIALRKATYTYDNVCAGKVFTVSVPSVQWMQAADYCGMVSGKDTDKFADTGLTPVRSDIVDAPYVAEFPLVLECVVISMQELGLHTQCIGEIKDVKIDTAVLDQNEKPDLQKLAPMMYAPLRKEYYGVGAFLGDAFSVGTEIGDKKRMSGRGTIA